jgi:y4mF family transcriptional regulator
MTGPRQRQKEPDRPLAPLGDLVTARRVQLRLTQRELAELADVGLTTVHSVEHGSDRITLAILLRVLDVLGVTLQAETRDGSGPRHITRIRHPARP